MASPGRTKYYSPLKAENDQKDIVVAELKAENFELRTRERDYTFLHSQLLDLERRYSLLREDKLLQMKDTKGKDALRYNTIDHLKAEIDILRRDLDRKLTDSRDLVTEANVFKSMLDEKNVEIAKLKEQIANEAHFTRSVQKEKNLAESELGAVMDNKRATGMSLTAAQVESKRLSDLKAEDHLILRDKELELSRQERKHNEGLDEIGLLGKEKRDLDAACSLAREGRRVNNLEVDRLVILNDKLQEERRAKDDLISQLQLEGKRMGRKVQDGDILLEAKDRQLREGRETLSYVEHMGTDTRIEVERLLREKDAAGMLAERNKKDANLNEMLRKEEMIRYSELANEKKDLERKLIDKELEAYTNKKQLGSLAANADAIIDRNYAMNDELSALKDHSDVLSTHHNQLSKEIDRFVEIDESFRNKLHVKPRVESLMKMQDLELEKSMQKVKNSQSPVRKSPNKASPYKSPYRSPKY